MLRVAEAAFDRFRWLPATAVVLLPVVSTICLVFSGGEPGDGGDWAWLGAGVLALLAAAALQIATLWWRRQSEGAAVDERRRLRVAMKDALQPMVSLMATMPPAPKAERESLLRQVAEQAAGALRLLLRDVDRVRAVVYALSPDGRSLTHIAYGGRGTTPGPFTAGDARGDGALAMVASGDSRFVPDISQAPPAWAGTGRDYATFISAAISTGDYAYGMLTVDAPEAGDLVDTDVEIVLVVAGLLAVAFAEAERR